MDPITQIPSISYDTYMRIQIALDVIAVAFVAARVLTNYQYSKKIAPDDCEREPGFDRDLKGVALANSLPVIIDVSTVAVVVLISYSTSSFLMTRAFVSPDTTVASITRYRNNGAEPTECIQISVACLFTGGAAMYFAKAPLLLLYIRIFGIKRWLRVVCYTVLLATAIVYLVCALYSGIRCVPADGLYDDSFVLECAQSTFVPALCRCFTSIFTDLVALSLPLSVVVKLQLPRGRKIGLALVFMTGILNRKEGERKGKWCVSLYYQWKMKKTSNSSDMTVAMLCTCLECAIAIIVGCAPALHTLWTAYIAKTRLIYAIKSSCSSQRTDNTSQSPLQRIKVTTYRYVAMDGTDTSNPVYQANAAVVKGSPDSSA
ncbi:hypothetical protein PG984_003294 [Apiospora sp. TS-2023a]